jgi:hypothetical protein
MSGDWSGGWDGTPDLPLTEPTEACVHEGYSSAETITDDSETDDPDAFEFDFEGGGGMRKKTTPAGTNGGLPNFKEDHYDKDYWHASFADTENRFVRLKDKLHGGDYCVPTGRVNKAMRFLHLPTIAATLMPISGSCRCKRSPACYTKFTTAAILCQRYSFFQQLNEVKATQYLADLVRAVNTKTTDYYDKLGEAVSGTNKTTPGGSATKPSPRIHWVLTEADICSEYFQKVFGISRDKLSKVRLLLRGSAHVPAPRVEVCRPRIAYNQCKTFWRSFFKNCQRPNDHLRLFPVNMSFPSIYEDFFTPWFEKTYPAQTMPCLGYFSSARHDEEFGDVKNRSKHHHCRCPDCANLQARRLTAFKSEHDKDEYRREWQDHQTEKRNWREHEKEFVLRAKVNPKDVNVFWFDDTESTGFPKMTKRTLKNLPTSRFDLIPFLIADLGRGKDYYIYTAKNRFKKGANRLATSLLAAIRATKNSTDDARFARKLVLIADNFAENKNNTLLAFCSDLVARGWYDSIKLVYGMPGHTHNGGDQQHQIHNEVLGNFTSLTPVHLLARYPQAWRQEHTRPEPCILDVQYDWDNYYKPFMDPLGGHTKTPCDPVACRGFKIQRGKGGIIELKWKTKAESGKWRGADGGEKSAGFALLKGRPRGKPVIIQPNKDVMKKKYYKQLFGNKMREVFDSEGSKEAWAWLKKAARHGVMPVHKRLQEPKNLTGGNFGALAELKCDDVTATVQMIEDCDYTVEEFWALPTDVANAVKETRAAEEALSKKHRLHPAIGYKRVKRKERPTYPNSAAHELDERKESGDLSEAEDSPWSDASAEDLDENTEAIQNNSSRSAGRQNRADPARKRQKAQPTDVVSVKEKSYKVSVMFGSQSGTAELWFGINLPGGKKGNKKIQFLQADPNRAGHYELIGSTSMYPPTKIVHTFDDIPFEVTTTTPMTKGGKKKKSGIIITTKTKMTLDQETLKSLEKSLAEWVTSEKQDDPEQSAISSSSSSSSSSTSSSSSS